MSDITPDGTEQNQKKKKVAPLPKDKKQERLEALDTAFDACDMEGTGRVQQTDLVEYTGKSKQTVRNWVDEHPGYVRENGIIRRVQSVKK